ncbi:MAG: GMC family oxidoreductase [Candidatus Marinimicrobia bacterium]|nr:GMC family oxidoreductase [Candidatus Neomarinimicrobiota bacterium]
MPVIDIRQLDNKRIINSDVCIVGGGISGVILAEKLSEKSKVSLIESGDIKPNDEIQSLYNLDCVGYPLRPDFQSRVRQLGGSCNLWPGRCMILNELDFRKREWVNYSGWPITYAELIQYYQPAAVILNLPSIELFKSDYKFNEYCNIGKSIRSTNKFIFRNSLWAKKPERFGHKTRHWHTLKTNQNITMYIHANLNHIELSESKQAVNSILVKTLSEKSFIFKSRFLILACGGIENARILLSSRSQMKNGVGNDHDLVGRYYMDHPTAVSTEIKLKKKIFPSYLFGLPIKNGRVQIGIGFNDDYQSRKGLLNNYVQLEPKFPQKYEEAYEVIIRNAKKLLRKGYSGHRFTFGNVGITKIPEIIYLLTPKDLIPHFLIRWYSGWQKLFARPIGADQLVMVHHLEQEPDPESRVLLNHEKDVLGMNCVSLNWKISNKSKRTADILQRQLYQYLKQTGLVKRNDTFFNENLSDFKDASHHMGTTRMGENEKTGVVDKNCKVFGIDNLYIAGSSIFPTSGHANSTLTIAALALRLAEHIRMRMS